MMNFFKGYSSDSELSSSIAKLMSLDAQPVAQLSKSRWIFPEGTIMRLFKTARKELKVQPSLLQDIPAPLVVVGDLHGDMYTLIEIIKHHGMPPKTNYLFLGDYVDRGPNGVETFLLPLLLLTKFPRNVFCLRGNHESIMMSRCYGFLEECRHRYSTRIYMAAVKCFDLLPVAGIVAGKIFAIHGGLSPRMDSIQDIASIQRPVKLQPGTLLTDVLWGDPTKEELNEEFSPSDRGAGFLFGVEPCTRFLLDNGFVAMVRGHEVVAKGVRVHFGCCWTVFSHPRYMGLRNVAASLLITRDLEFEPHFFPYCGEDLEDLLDQPLVAEEELEPQISMHSAESVIADWAGEKDDLFDAAVAECSPGSSYLDYPAHACTQYDASEADYKAASAPTEVPSIAGTEESSPSNLMSPHGGSPRHLSPAQALGVAAGR